jgi:hypothetical protein
MDVGNRAKIQPIDSWSLKDFFIEGRNLLGGRKDIAVSDRVFNLVPLESKLLEVKEFNIGVRMTPGHIVPDFGSKNVIQSYLEGKMDIRRYTAQFSRRYELAGRSLDVLVSQDQERIFIVQPFEDRHVIQWITSTHDAYKQEILSSPEFALLQCVDGPFSPLIALSKEDTILSLGEATIAAAGNYRIIQ